MQKNEKSETRNEEAVIDEEALNIAIELMDEYPEVFEELAK